MTTEPPSASRGLAALIDQLFDHRVSLSIVAPSETLSVVKLLAAAQSAPAVAPKAQERAEA